MEFRFKHKGLMIQSYINESFNKSLIFIPGLPQYLTKNHDLIRELTKLEFNIFIPQYYGSFDSNGLFTLNNCIKTVNDCLSFVKKGNGNELYNQSLKSWNNENLKLMGFSFGALPVLACQTNINKVLLNPFINFKVHEEYDGENLTHTFNFINKAFPNSYRFKTKELITDLKNFDYNKLLKNQSRIKIVRGLKDESIPLQEIKWLSKALKINIIELDKGHTSRLSANEFEKILNTNDES